MLTEKRGEEQRAMKTDGVFKILFPRDRENSGAGRLFFSRFPVGRVCITESSALGSSQKAAVFLGKGKFVLYEQL